MNIAVFIKKTTYHDGYGGLETQNKALCEGLASRGHKLTIFSPKNGFSEDELFDKNLHYVFIECSYRSLAGFGHLDKNNWVNKSVAKFKELQRNAKFDIVISQSSAGLGIIRKKNELGIKVISICHGSTLGELRTTIQSLYTVKDYVSLIAKLGYYALNYFGRQREFVLHADHVVAVSNFVKNAIISETFISEGRVSVIYNGLGLVPRDRVATEELLITYVGLIHWSKGLKDLLFAVKDIRNPAFKVAIIGDGPHLGELKQNIESLHLSDKVSAIGKVTNSKAVEYMQKSSIFVLPSKRVEGFPVSLVEAMFCRLPIVAANIGGISESVKDGFSGILYKPSDLSGLKDALTKLISDRELRNTMGNNGLRMASELFTLDVMLNKYEQVMEDVLI